ncbi:sensor histidine kinase [Streptomyces sp. B6B3]|uniref:sensor histidine kinase n=1 Tax=Streptomyces sp. B6B3 TaxID=3153570 RepID=UPI00325D9525
MTARDTGTPPGFLRRLVMSPEEHAALVSGRTEASRSTIDWGRIADRTRARLHAWTSAPAYPWVSVALLAVLACVFCLVWGSDVVEAQGDRATLTCGEASCGHWDTHGSELRDGILRTVLSAAAMFPLMWRRRYPGLAAHLAIPAGLVTLVFYPETMLTAAVCLCFGLAILTRHRIHHSVTAAGYGLVALVVVNRVDALWKRYGEDQRWIESGLQRLGGPSDWLLETLPLACGVLITVALAELVRTRDARTRREQEAAQARLIARERRRAAEDERADIARELHDIVSHSVSVIAVRAESATYTTPGLSPEARTEFQAIATHSRESLDELRQLLTVLRSAGQGQPAAADAPQPTLAGLADLVERHRSAGGSAELRVEDPPAGLPASVELSAYRIVQEALTNARRHAPEANVLVEIEHRPDRLGIRVSDDGPGPSSGASATEGLGLIGIRERVTLLGGRFESGSGPDGGFRLGVELPLHDEPAEARIPRETP